MGEALTVKLKNCATDRVGRQYPSRAMFAMMFAPWVEDYHQGIKDETDETVKGPASPCTPPVFQCSLDVRFSCHLCQNPSGRQSIGI